MISAEFEYHRPTSLEEALRLLKELGEDAKLLAGGHSLIPMMKLRVARYSHIIDIGRISELKGLEDKGDHLLIGALVTHREVEKSDLIKSKVPILSECASQIADVQVRNMGTVGGSMVHADPSADYPPVMLVLDAKVVAKNLEGEREIDVDDFFVSAFTTALKEDEILTAVKVPVMKEGEKAFYTKLPHPATGFALVSCAVKAKVDGKRLSDVRVAFGGFVLTPYRDKSIEAELEGKELTPELIDRVCSMVGEGQDIIGDWYADEEYRREVARAYLRRALESLTA